jgi:hypothetical protein
MKNTSTDSPTEAPAPKPPIYPVSVIEVAFGVVSALKGIHPTGFTDEDKLIHNEAWSCAMRIIRDGLASHERAIKGEP